LKTLRKTIELDRITNVRIIPKALSDKVGDATLYQWPDGPLGIGLLKEPFDYTGIMDRQLRMDDRDCGNRLTGCSIFTYQAGG
jgi:hypothetical protein